MCVLFVRFESLESKKIESNLKSPVVVVVELLLLLASIVVRTDK